MRVVRRTKKRTDSCATGGHTPELAVYILDKILGILSGIIGFCISGRWGESGSATKQGLFFPSTLNLSERGVRGAFPPVALSNLFIFFLWPFFIFEIV